MIKEQIKLLADNLINHFISHQNLQDALSMKNYMKDNFEFIGLKKDLRVDLVKNFWIKNELPEGDGLKEFVQILWNQPYRELHYVAMQLLEKPIKKKGFRDIDFLEYLVVNQSWWDSVDYIAVNLIGKLLFMETSLQQSYPAKWIISENMWLRRTAILYQLKFKNKTDSERLFDYILQTAHEKEIFISKAQGWALREYAKTNPQAVISFVEENRDKMSNLTIKEALKHLINK